MPPSEPSLSICMIVPFAPLSTTVAKSPGLIAIACSFDSSISASRVSSADRRDDTEFGFDMPASRRRRKLQADVAPSRARHPFRKRIAAPFGSGQRRRLSTRQAGVIRSGRSVEIRDRTSYTGLAVNHRRFFTTQELICRTALPGIEPCHAPRKKSCGYRTKSLRSIPQFPAKISKAGS